ncbi:IS4 family transposase [Actinospica robiniae]|uniref:IS4 family transposase n=2 Tax=Actinospica robiniae TaxID=304901 RepID=UPI0003F79C5E|nr:IS4 family transposase [Actinospica robiniae]
MIPFELVDAVLAETGRTERRVRRLPSRVALYLVLAMALFEKAPISGVFSVLSAGLRAPAVSEKALRDARRRIGPEPVKALFDVLAGPIAQPHTPGTRYRRWRTVAFDGCSSTKIPDTPDNRAVYGRAPVRHGHAGYPMLMLMTLAETGTRALAAAVFGPSGTGEIAYAEKLLAHLDASMLLLADRGFDAAGFLAKAAGTGAHLLVRATANRRPPVLAHLPDGSYLTLIGTLRMRVIEAEVTVTATDGSTHTGTYRLITTLLEHRSDPAPTLLALYHERWETETAFLAIRHTLLDGRVLRSRDPAGLAQEMWGILTVYQALRTLMCEAAETIPGTDPDRMSFTLALHTARTHTILADLGNPTDRPGPIGHAVLAPPQPRPPPPPQHPQTQIPRPALHLQRPHQTHPQHHDHRHHPHDPPAHHHPATRPTPRPTRPTRPSTREKPRPEPPPTDPRPAPTHPRDRRRPRYQRPKTHQQPGRQNQPLGPPRTPDQNSPRHLHDQETALDRPPEPLTTRHWAEP